MCMHAQLCLTHCNPMECSMPGSSVDGILKNTCVGCHFFLQEIFSSLPTSPVSPAFTGGFFTTVPPGKPN